MLSEKNRDGLLNNGPHPGKNLGCGDRITAEAMLVRILTWVENTLLHIISVMFLFIVILTLVQVFCRYVLNDALSWSAELTKIVFVWMTFLGSAAAVQRKRHMRIDTIINLLPLKWQIVTDIIVYILIAVFLVVLSYHGIELVGRTSRLLTGALRWPRSLFSLPIVLGGSMMFVFCLRIIGENFNKLAGKQEV
jgi:TRAP-type C4-dicarboxylate transport system permease small subunit